MIKENQRILNLINLLSDVALTFLAYFAAIGVRFDVMDGVQSVDLRSVEYIQLIALYCAAELILFYMMQIYAPQRYRRVSRELFSIFLANGICLLLLVTWLYLRRISDVSRIMILIFYCLSSGLIGLKHVFVRFILRYMRRRGFNQKHVVLVGNGSLAMQYVQNTLDNPQMGFCVDGYIADEQKDGLGRWLGTLSQVKSILKGRDVDELVIALPIDQEGWMHTVIDAANRYGLRAKIVPQYNDYIPANPTIDVIGSTKLINLNASPLDNLLNAAFKRLSDILLSAAGLVLVSPLMLVTAIGVKLSSPGPVFFVQQRVGRNCKIFPMLKFRSMRVNSTEETAWTTDEDPRKTAFGSFIRKTSIDELPQLFNVLIGQMSLVGPRPEIPYHVDHFQEEIPNYMIRQRVRPGITGWAQINGFRGDTDIGKRIEMDLGYIQNWSVRLDAEILWKTVMGGFMNQETITTGRKNGVHEAHLSHGGYPPVHHRYRVRHRQRDEQRRGDHQ